MTQAFVYDAIRTPRGKGKKDGSLYEVKPISLLAGVLTELQRRNDLDTSQVDDVVMGVVSPVGEQGSVIAKVAALRAGWDFRCSGVQLNRFCASGLEAVNLAAQKVRSGWEDLVVAGGVESMSRVPIGSDGGAWAQDPRDQFGDRLRAAGHRRRPDRHAGRLLAASDVDAFALESQQRAAGARADGLFAGSIVPVTDFLGQTLLAQDEFIKPNTTHGRPRRAQAVVRRDGRDGLRRRGADPLSAGRAHPPRAPRGQRVGHRRRRGRGAGRLARQPARRTASRRGRASSRPRVSGADPTIMLTGPMPATRKALAKAGLTIDDIDLFEVNEAFAAVPMRFMREMGVPHDKVNVNGGAIAMGHPLGATGAMILGTLIDELHRRKLRYGLATLCVGGGMGIATIVERI